MMKLKEVALSSASAEAKIAGLAVLLDKELLRLSELVVSTKKLQGPQGEQGLQGPKGEQGDRGFDGANGKDGANGADGRQGEDGKEGVGVADAKVDFDGSLVITLTNGREINAGDVIPEGVADKIKVIKSGGGNSQTVLDAIDEINAIISTYGTMATQDDASVDINGGAIDGTPIGATTASTGVFTTLSTGALTATGQTSLGGAAGSEGLRVGVVSSAVNFWYAQGSVTGGGVQFRPSGGDTNIPALFSSKGNSQQSFYTNTFAQEQLRVAHTASAVNYVQVTGSATGSGPIISTAGSDTNVGLAFRSKGSGFISFGQDTTNQFEIIRTASAVNRLRVTGSTAGNAPILASEGSDTNIDLTLTPKGTGKVRFGTYTANMALVVQGYIEIKDSGGTVRKLAVIA